MTRADMPTPEQIRNAADALIAEVRQTGGRPSVLALTRRFGLSNSTFRRHFPDIARELAQVRRTPTPEVSTSADGQRYTKLQDQNADLRRRNAELSNQVELAIATIQRLTLRNHQLTLELEAGSNVTPITRLRKR